MIRELPPDPKPKLWPFDVDANKIAREALEAGGKSIHERIKALGLKVGTPEVLAERAASGEEIDRPEGVSAERWAAMVKNKTREI